MSEVILENKDKFSKNLIPHLPRITEISRRLRRDRELAFYGSEDLTPSEFYKKEDAVLAQQEATWIVSTVEKSLTVKTS